MDEIDSFGLNILGPQNLIASDTNKINDFDDTSEGVDSELYDELELPIDDETLLSLKDEYENKSAPYEGKLLPRQQQNKTYLLGMQKAGGKTVPSNILFQATATFVPQALAKNPEPVVWSDDTDEGKQASNDIKTMLQFQAMNTGLRQKLGLMVWHWSTYFTAVIKYGWNKDINDVDPQVRKPKNFLLDPDGYVDEFGAFIGDYVGERMRCTAKELIKKFPKHADYIKEKVSNKLGTLVVSTEWWNDEYCFTTFEDRVLDKHKNEFYNYEGENHFAKPMMPYTFLSVFSMQEAPHDFTNLIEQNISNQDRINDRDYQIAKNLKHSNNGLVLDDKYFNSETAHQAANAVEEGDPILGNPDGVKRLEAPALPNGVIEAQERYEEKLQSIYGTLGLSAQQPNEDTTARGMILNQSHDSSRIGGGVGDALEIVATSYFNWMLQLMYVFYDEKHYAAIMGNASAVEYVGLIMTDHPRKYIVSVAPDSMQPKDELSQINQTIQLWEAKAIDPIGLFKGINDPDPINSAKRLVLWTTNPQLYLQTFFPETAGQPDSTNPPPPGQSQPEAPQAPPTLSQEPASASLNQVQLPA